MVRSWFSALAVLALSAGASAIPTKFILEPHEAKRKDRTYVAPEGPVRYSAPNVSLGRNGVVLRQVNVGTNGLNIVGDAANEPSLAVSPVDRNKIAVGWRQFDTITSDFRQAGYGFSSDGGSSWTFPARIDAGVFRSDPVLAAGADGTFYYHSLQQTFFCDLFKSTNGGSTYSLVGPAVGGDKQWYIVDDANGVQYQAWSTAGNNYNGRQFSRTFNGGQSWANPINLPNRPIWGTLDTDTNGNLYICGTNSQAPDFALLKSTNAKNPAVTPTFTARTWSLGAEITVNVRTNPGGLGGQTWICVDKSNGPRRNWIYLLCSVGTANETNVRMLRSTDGGNTFSAFSTVNDHQVAGHHRWFGTMSIAPNGRLDATWNDTRLDTVNRTNSALFYSYSLDGGVTWSANQQITNTFNPLVGWPIQNKMGDYNGMVSDNDGVSVAFAATLNGEQDVWFARIPAPEIPIRGTVTLGDFPVGPSGRVLAAEVRDSSSNAILQTTSASLDANGSYQFALDPDLVHRPITVRLKGSHWLAKRVSLGNVDLVGRNGVNATLINGDIDGDNSVTIFDYVDLGTAFDSFTGDQNWNPEADLDGDGSVTIFDYIILSTNFDQFGE